MILYPCQPYAMQVLRRVLARFPYPALFALTEHAVLRVLHQPQGAVLVELQQQSDDSLLLQDLHGTTDPALVAHAFGTDCDLSAFYQFAHSDPLLSQMLAPLIGLPVWREESLYQALVFVIIEQHISWKNARLAQRNLLEWGGNSLQANGHTLFALPTPQQLASATVDDLIPLKITFKRMQMLIDLARAIVEGTIDLDAWMRLDAAALYDKLCSLHGVGHWTAAVVVTRTKGIFQHIAHNDVALQAAVAHYFQTGKSAPDVLRIMGQYGEYGGLVAHFTLMRWVLDRYPLQTDFAL